MAKNSNDLIEETEKLKIENEALRQQLKEAMESIDAIKTGQIDALVAAQEKDLKVFTEEAADKPYRILIEKMNEGAVTLNEDGTILYCNSYFSNMVKLPMQKVIGTMFENFMGDSSQVHLRNFLKQQEVNVLKEEIHIYASNGKEIPILMTLNTLPLDNISVISIILTDLTIHNENQEKLKQKTKQLEQKNKELEIAVVELAFQIDEKEKREAELSLAETDVKELEGLNVHKERILYTIAHDLRSPLAGIIQTTELLKEDFETMEAHVLKEKLELLYNLSKDELSMLDSLVDWARIKYASEAFVPANIELVKYIKKVFDTFNEIAISNNIHLQNTIKENILVYADPKMLQSILQNIVSNSIKNTPPGGKVTALVERKEDSIIIEIRDTGIGMSKEVKEKLFAPQMKDLAQARKEKKGAGIGLLLIKGFVDKNGGEIFVESIVGKGTSFYFTLPASKSEE